jgi:hypothetical protein
MKTNYEILTNSTENPWETNSHSVGQEISSPLLNPVVHFLCSQEPALRDIGDRWSIQQKQVCSKVDDVSI